MARPTKPIELKELEGNPGRRRLPKKLGFAEASNRTPTELSGVAAEWYKATSAELRKLGILKAVDIPELILVARAYANAYEASLMLKKGCVINKDGEAVANPFEVIFRQNTRLYHDLAGNFGLNPSDRSRIAANISANNDSDYAETTLKDLIG